MLPIFTVTVREFDSLAALKAEAAVRFAEDAVAGRVVIGSLPFGFVGVREDGRADLLDTGIRCGQPVVFA